MTRADLNTSSASASALPSRRRLLQSIACGFGGLAAGDLLAAASSRANPLAARQPHHRPRAKRVIFLFMHGGPSQVDTFDPKPRLAIDDGKPLPFGRPDTVPSPNTVNKVLASPWTFKRYGQCGMDVSELFPHIATHVDDLCFIRSMVTDSALHGGATPFLHTGAQNLVRPSMGSWISYGLGTENQNLPSFITICPTRAHGGVQNFGSAFLPATHQGTTIGDAAQPVSKARVRYLKNDRTDPGVQRKKLQLLRTMTDRSDASPPQPLTDGILESFELAARMQSQVPELMDISTEPQYIRDLYGLDTKPTDEFSRACILARRFAEAGVRYIQVSHSFKWDQHKDLKKDHESNAMEVDRPIAGLLSDLKNRGMLDDTLIWWGGEFGRTPIAEQTNGRDHNPHGFTMWLAGGGVRGGMVHGRTDDYGFYAVENKVHMHDLHATILHQMGIDHERLTYRHAGRDFRLTDVYGNVVHEILA